jgi:polysaccharide export outer membrane protein
MLLVSAWGGARRNLSEPLMRRTRRINVFAGALSLALLSACSDGFVRFPTTAEGQRALGDDIEVLVLDTSNIGDYTSPARGYEPSSLPAGREWTYQVGPGDILSVIVFDHPELTLPAGPQRSASESGFQVGSDGTISYPFIGSVVASGRSVDQIRSEISERLAKFIPDPQVDVRVADFNSQAVVVSGEVRTPNRQPLTAVGLTLIEAINAAGGFSEYADARVATVQRGGKSYKVDVEGFLSGGLAQNNPLLRNGDVVSIPRRRAEEAYLLGEVARPDVIDLSVEPITLTQAITRLGGLQQPRADARGVFVFRAVGERTRVFQLDTSSPEGLLLGTRFVLEPGDVVYVLRSPLQRWNDTIVRVLPTVEAINVADDMTN